MIDLKDLLVEHIYPPETAHMATRFPTGCKITHLPTGHIACSASERGLKKNREVCISILERMVQSSS